MQAIWKETTIGDAPIHIGDGNYSSMYPKSSEFVSSGVPFITASDFRNGRISPESFRFISSAQHATLKKGHLKKGDVLIVTRGNGVGNVTWVDAEFEGSNINAQLVLLRADENEIHNRFLYYLLSSKEYQELLVSFASGSAQPQIPIRSLVRVPVRYPSITEQHAIAKFLSVLDDKIEINRRMNRTLESMARAIFRQWFVENEDVEEWDVVPLPEIIEVNPTRLLKKGEVAPYLDMANMPTEGHRGIEWIDRSFGSGMKFINGDTLLARITPCLENGKTAFVDFLKDGQVGWGSTEYIIFRPKPPLTPEYGYYLARSEELRNHAIVNMTGTSGRQRTPASCFNNFSVAVPPIELAKRFGNFAKSVIDKVRANDEESRTLARLRDALLPKLMRGEVRVKDV